jgi:hypothetical protein
MDWMPTTLRLCCFKPFSINVSNFLVLPSPKSSRAVIFNPSEALVHNYPEPLLIAIQNRSCLQAAIEKLNVPDDGEEEEL